MSLFIEKWLDEPGPLHVLCISRKSLLALL